MEEFEKISDNKLIKYRKINKEMSNIWVLK